MPGRNSSGAEAATRCYNAEELLYDFLIIIIRNTSRGLLTVYNYHVADLLNATQRRRHEWSNGPNKAFFLASGR